MAPFAYHIRMPINELVAGEFKADVMSELGLSHLGVLHPGKDVHVTPAADGGVILAFDPSMKQKSVDQSWLEVSDRVSIGWLPKRPPSPEDLLKKDALPGIEVVDLSNRAWRLPIINSNSAMCSIPQAISYSHGQPTKRFLSKYQNLWEYAGDLFESVVSIEAYDDIWVMEKALEVLCINYRVSPMEVEAFDQMGSFVFSQAIAFAMLLYALDFKLVEDAVKKKQPGG